MFQRFNTPLSIFIILVTICFAGCASESGQSTKSELELPMTSETETTTKTETKQPSMTESEQPANLEIIPEIANPAAGYCHGLGYQEESRENETGRFWVCVFPDGSECDSWDFLGGYCGQEFSYCEVQNFTIKPGPAKGNIAICVFEDDSTCDEWLYFLGECKQGDNLP